MCLITSQTKPLIADKDITCYKLLKKGMHSCCYDFTWELGQLYHSRIEVEYSPYAHSTVIQNAFHTYAFCDTVKRIYCSQACASMIVKCTIPKGAVYYCGMHTGDDYGFASSQLIINEIMDITTVFKHFDWGKYPYRVGQKVRLPFDDDTTVYTIENIQPYSNYPNAVDIVLNSSNLDGETMNTVQQTDSKGILKGSDLKLEIL